MSQDIRSEVERLICATGAYVGTERTNIYVEKLSRYKPEIVKGAIDLTIEHWDRPKELPPIGYILSRVDEYHRKRVHEALEKASGVIVHREPLPESETVEDRRSWAAQVIREVQEAAKKKSL